MTAAAAGREAPARSGAPRGPGRHTGPFRSTRPVPPRWAARRAADGHLDAEDGPRPRDDLVARSEWHPDEEIVVRLDGRKPQHLGPQAGQDLLDGLSGARPAARGSADAQTPRPAPGAPEPRGPLAGRSAAARPASRRKRAPCARADVTRRRAGCRRPRVQNPDAQVGKTGHDAAVSRRSPAGDSTASTTAAATAGARPAPPRSPRARRGSRGSSPGSRCAPGIRGCRPDASAPDRPCDRNAAPHRPPALRGQLRAVR